VVPWRHQYPKSLEPKMHRLLALIWALWTLSLRVRLTLSAFWATMNHFLKNSTPFRISVIASLGW
jgi:hypothetical protein